LALLSTVASTLVVALLFHALPKLTRPELFFAVTVTRDFPASPDGRDILLGFRVRLWAGVAASLMVTALGLGEPLVAGLGHVVLLVAALWAFTGARRRVLPFAVAPSTVHEVALTPRSRALPGGWVVQLAPFAILVAVALATHAPPRRVSIAVATCGLLAGIALALPHTARAIAAVGAAAQAEREFKRLSLIMLLVAEYAVALVMLALALFGNGTVARWLSVAGTVVTVALALGLARLGQGGTRRVAPAAEAGGAPVGDRTRDEHSKWGLFYINRDDPALIVEKRFGLGYTVNLANPSSWAILVLIVAIVVAIVVAAISR
jgi:hypothetical protein